jgi:hypothetical protein
MRSFIVAILLLWSVGGMLYAQIRPILIDSGQTYMMFDIPVRSDADSFRIQVAEDSLFRTALPGIASMRWSTTTATNGTIRIPIFSLIPGTRYYFRVWAIKGQKDVDSSSVFVFKTLNIRNIPINWNGIPSNDLFSIFLKATTITPTRIALRWSKPIDTSQAFEMTIEDNFYSPQKTIRGLGTNILIDNLLPNRRYSFYVEVFVLPFGQIRGLTFLSTFTPQAFQEIKRVALYYQMPFTVTPSKEAVYYYKQDSTYAKFGGYGFEPGATISLRDTIIKPIDTLLLKLRDLKIPLDSAWLQTGGEAPVVWKNDFRLGLKDSTINIPRSHPSNLVVKLRAPDDERMAQLGFRRGVGSWAYSDYYFYFLYDFKTTTTIHHAPEQSIVSLTVAPNPTSEMAVVSIPLAKPASVRFEVMDAIGKTVVYTPSEYHSAGICHRTIDVSAYATGMYRVVAHITDEQGLTTRTSVALAIVK